MSISKTQKTNTIEIGHTTTGVPVSGFGAGVDLTLLFQADSSTTPLRNIGRISFVWDIATDATRTSHAIIEIVKNGDFVPVAKISADGEIHQIEE